jgi:glycosyltransferase involved in cell wall biosynthesis
MNYKKKIKFSIIVVSLNTKKEFIKSIKSIQDQNFKNFEIIVIDGNSADGTKNEILKRKKNISKFIIEKDKGIYHAMNKGIKLSEGEWIIFMNCGDVFFRNNVLGKFLSKDTSNYDIVYGDTQILNKNLKYIVKSKTFNYNTYLMPFCHQSVFVRSNILKKKNFSLKFKISSDFDFFYYCFISGKKFKKLNLIISKVKSGGLSDTHRQRVFNENMMIINKKGNKVLVCLLFLNKLNQYLKDLLKIILPNFTQKFIFKQKYKDYLIS